MWRRAAAAGCAMLSSPIAAPARSRPASPRRSRAGSRTAPGRPCGACVQVTAYMNLTCGRGVVLLVKHSKAIRATVAHLDVVVARAILNLSYLSTEEQPTTRVKMWFPRVDWKVTSKISKLLHGRQDCKQSTAGSHRQSFSLSCSTKTIVYASSPASNILRGHAGHDVRLTWQFCRQRFAWRRTSRVTRCQPLQNPCSSP